MQDLMIRVIGGIAKDVASDSVGEVVQDYIFESQIGDLYRNKWLKTQTEYVVKGT